MASSKGTASLRAATSWSTRRASCKPPIRVHVRDAAGQPVTGVRVSFTYTMDMPGMSIAQSQARNLGNGLYEGVARFSMGGPWGLVVQIEQPGKAAAREK